MKVYTVWPFDAAEAKRRQEETAKALGVPVEQDIDLGKGVKMTFVLIPAGESLMGHPETPSSAELHGAYGGLLLEFLEWERPQHRVRISRPFWLGKCEVTQEQWQTLMGQNPSARKDRPQNPVEQVNWHECQEFFQKLSAKLRKTFRLPTEAEWEHACRAGAATEFHFGDGATDLGDYAWFSANSGASTQPVGRKKPNAWGLHDMAGNVGEWCEDWFAPYGKGAQTDPKGPQTGDHRVFRGGMWQFTAGPCRSAARAVAQQGAVRWPTLGFRVCLAADPPEPPLPPLPPGVKLYTDWPFDAAEAKRRQEETAKALGVPVEQDIDLGKGVKMAFVLIPAGEFLMGSPPTTTPEKLAATYGGGPKYCEGEFPQHRVKISRPFWLGKHEVTQEGWLTVFPTNPSNFKEKPKNPVEQVDWNQATGFAKVLSEKLGKSIRLPTEAEWEYACCAGTATEFYFGNDAAKFPDFGWRGNGSTMPVGMKKPNAWGLFDMAGNVWEWCEDWYGPYDSAAQTDPKGAPAGGARVLRGGSWDCSSLGYLRSAYRYTFVPGHWGYNIGFRAVLAMEAARPQAETPASTETPQPAETRVTAYAPQSDKVWDLFRQRKYAEAETLLSELAKRPEFKGTAPLKADAEAAALLKEFWAAVEKGLCEAKGRFLSVASTSGTLEEAKDGVVRIRTAQGKPVEKELTQLVTKQALYYFRHSGRAGQPLPAAPHTELVVGVFLLAEGTMLDEAGKALADAGEGPSVALYKERLNAQLTAAAEAAAQKAWLRIEEEATGKLDPAKAARLTKSLADFAKAHSETKFHKGLAEKLAALKTRIEDSLVFTEWPFDEKEAKRRQKVTADALGVKIEQDIEIAKGVKITFVLIPAGEFLMGSPPTTSPEKLAAAYGGEPKLYEGEFPQHRVKFRRPFWIGKHEVTQEQWMAFLQTNPSFNKDKPRNPLEQVDWNQARGFAKVLSEKLGKTFRLPTEAEWEYACRAGTATEFYFGNDAAKLPDFGCSGGGPSLPVGQKKPNAWGLFDMAGNVWEWCEDCYGKYESAAQTDPQGAPAGGSGVIRGGCWLHPPGGLRSAYREAHDHGVRSGCGGFRVVLAPGPR